MAGFGQILGHKQVISHLENAIMLGKVSHAYLISGEEGCGKMTLANAFAMTLQCEKGGKDACMECRSCRQCLTRNQPDIIYVKHEKPNTISVDDIRTQINQEIQIRPYSSPYKIYIVDEAEKMNVAAQNALLKTIEEPPEYAVILLLTSNQEGLLATIRSRCVALSLKAVTEEEIRAYLKNVLGVPEDQAHICAAFAQGNIGKAARLSGSEDFNEIKNATLHLLKRIKDLDVYELVEGARQIVQYRLTLGDFFDLCMVWFRDVLLYKATGDMNGLVFQDEIYDIKKQASNSSYEGIQEILNALEDARRRVDANVNLELVLELLLLTIKEN